MSPDTIPDRPTILIVDDTPANLGVVVESLETHGFRVVIAQDGEEGIERAKFVGPDLILLDVMMPGLNGFEACRRLKADAETRDIPVIFMTSLTETEDKVIGFRVGGVDYVTKPLQIAEVLERVQTHLGLLAERESARHRLQLLGYALDRVAESILLMGEDSPAFLYVNESAARTLGYSREAMTGGMGLFDIDPGWSPAAWAEFWDRLRAEHTLTFESTHRTRDGRTFPVEVTGNYFVFAGQVYNLAICRDSTARKRAEQELRRINRALRMLSDSNQSLIRITDEGTLLAGVCRSLIEVGGYRSAWVGFTEGTEAGIVRPAVPPEVAADSPDANHPVPTADALEAIGSALRTGEPSVSRRQMRLSPPEESGSPAPPADAVMALPLVSEGRTFGVLVIHAVAPEAFDDLERTILIELAGDLAFGLTVLRTRAERDRATAVLQEHEAQLQLALEGGRLGQWQWDIPTGAITCSATCKTLYGLPADAEMSYERFLALVHPEDRDRVAAGLRGAVANHAPYDVEHRILWQDGTLHWAAMRGRVFGDGDGTRLRMAGVAMDVTERRRVEETLRANTLRLLHQEAALLALARKGAQQDGDILAALRRITENSARALEAARVGLWRYSPDRTALRCVDMYCLGTGRHELAADLPVQKYPSFFEALARSDVLAADDAHAEPRTRELSADYLRPLGIGSVMDAAVLLHGQLEGVVSHEHVGGPRAWTQDERTFAVAIANAVALVFEEQERKEAEASLRRSQEAYATLVDSVDGIVWEADPATRRFSFVSQKAERLLGYPTERWTGDPDFWQAHIHPDDQALVVGHWAEAARSSRGHDCKYRMMTADGRTVWLHDLVTVVAVPGHPTTLRGIMVDITESKRGEEALRLFRTLLDRTNDMIEVTDPDTGRILDVNEKACQVSGFSREEYLTLRMQDIERGLDLGTEELWREHVAELRRAGFKVMEGQYRRKDGSRFPVEIIVTYVHLDRDYLVSVARDISERRRADEALRASEQRFRQVTENIDEVFWLTDPSKREMIYVSPAYSRVWGRSCDSLYADPLSWLESVHPEDRDRVTAVAMQPSSGFDMEYRILHPDGTTRWVHDRAFPVRGPDGLVHRIAGLAEDITTRRRLEDQIRQSQRMDAVGQLAGGIAHDFNNLLMAIQLQSSLLLEGDLSQEETRDGVHEIMAATERATNLTRQLLTFSRRGVRQPQEVDLGEIAGGMTRLLRRLLGEDIELVSRFAPGRVVVHADPGMMEQVLMNLAVNARDAMPDGGQLAVSLDLVQVDANHVAVESRARPGRFARLTVRDTGTGIAPEHLAHIFEPFFTTKEVGKGTGLGLATVFGIVEQHQGWVEVDTEVGRGTAFHVYLPALEGSATPRATAASTAAPARGTETILLVEDEPAVRRLASVALERCGYTVIEAESASAALRRWETLPGPVDLLLTDLIMPGGLSGSDLAETLTARHPGLRVLFTSGYTTEVVQRQLRLGPGRAFLPKPYPLAELAAAVRRCLDQPPARPTRAR